jgi:hypothetical protein
MQAIFDKLSEHPALVFSIFSIGLLVLHIAGFRFKRSLIFIALILILVSFLFGALAYQPEPIPFGTMVAVLFLYGSGLFVFLSELLLGKVGRFLTDTRGEKGERLLDRRFHQFGGPGQARAQLIDHSDSLLAAAMSSPAWIALSIALPTSA